jgi:glutamate-1-semialdehyde aminotransferase
MTAKIIHTRTFHCDDDHPIVWYTFDESNKAICGYCATQFVYEEEDFYTKMIEEKELLNMGLKDSIKQKEERTPSEEMQDKLEPIPCPMHEDYDDEKTNV